MKNNQGFSFIEIILVIAIAAILIGSSVGGLQYMKYANTKRCAYEINSMLDKVRLEAMSKADRPYLYIYRNNDIYYMKATSGTFVMDDKGYVLANRSLRLLATDEIGNTSTIAEGTYVKIGFIRNTGAFLPCGGASGNTAYKSITVEGNKTYTVKMVIKTGKHFVE